MTPDTPVPTPSPQSLRAWVAIAALALTLLPAASGAAAPERENLLINGDFDAGQVDFPEFWDPNHREQVVHSPAGGPGGKTPAIILRGDGSKPGAVSARQQGLTLVPGEIYRLSAWVKTQGFTSKSGGVVIHNNGWTAAAGITGLPADSGWTFREQTLRLMPSADREYGVAIYAVKLAGEIHTAQVRLEAVSEAARKGSRSQAAVAAVPRLFPTQPLLNRIPLRKPEITFQFYGRLPDPRAAYECLAATGRDPAATRSYPLPEDGKIVVRLEGVPAGDHTLKLAVRHRATQASAMETDWQVSLVDLPSLNLSQVRPLNSLVSELLSEPAGAGPEHRSFRFVQPRDGWVFVAVTAPQATPGLVVRIDEGDPVITAATDRLEAFRELPRGEHRITLSGGTGTGARLVVRSIPEIFDYPPCANSQVTENGSYGWAFMKRHILPAVTTLNGGVLPGPALREAQALGLKWLANFNVHSMSDPAELRNRMEQCPGMTQPQYDGFTSDELFFGRLSIDAYTRALRQLHNPEHRLVYTWIVGKPSIASVHSDFMSAALNASKGRGRLLFEAYCHPQPDEASAAAYLDGMLGETMRRFAAFYPDAAAGTGVIFGNFNQIPIISLEHDPAVDFKYFLDMQVNRVANGPEFLGLATTGYWGTYYGDEELVRWSFKLMRHYAVEGNRDLLAARHGFTYRPGLLVNGDFADGWNGWTPAPAAAGSLRTATVPGYGKSSQGRWGAGSAGDTVCVMTRRDGTPNRLRQTARGLQPGKAYCLQFVTADFRDVTRQTYRPRRYGVGVDLEGAAILPDRSWVHVDRRRSGPNGKEANTGKINLHRVVFRAAAAGQPVEFTDAAAEPGEELMLNFVQLKPYLE